MNDNHPRIDFIPISTDPDKIRFFGTFFPGLLLLLKSPLSFFLFPLRSRFWPTVSVDEFLESGCDDFALIASGGPDLHTIITLHAWKGGEFDPVAFGATKVFLRRLALGIVRDGYAAEVISPLEPAINLALLAIEAGLGTPSPYGLLVHKRFGPRVIIGGIRTNHPALVQTGRSFAESVSEGCTNCGICLAVCPQKPLDAPVIELRRCQSCAKCITLCPVGKAIGVSKRTGPAVAKKVK